MTCSQPGQCMNLRRAHSQQPTIDSAAVLIIRWMATLTTDALERAVGVRAPQVLEWPKREKAPGDI